MTVPCKFCFYLNNNCLNDLIKQEAHLSCASTFCGPFSQHIWIVVVYLLYLPSNCFENSRLRFVSTCFKSSDQLLD